VSKKSDSISEKIATSAAITVNSRKISMLMPRPNVSNEIAASSRGSIPCTPGAVETSAPATACSSRPSAVAAMMPIKNAPRTRRASSSVVRNRPNTAIRTGQPVSVPSVTGGEGCPVATPSTTRTLSTGTRTRPALTRPMKRMNAPMPIPIARFNASGIALSTASRKPVSTSTVMIRPSMNTAPIAAGQLTPRPRMRV
jgi:hypothetical protein